MGGICQVRRKFPYTLLLIPNMETCSTRIARKEDLEAEEEERLHEEEKRRRRKERERTSD